MPTVKKQAVGSDVYTRENLDVGEGEKIQPSSGGCQSRADVIPSAEIRG